MINEELTFQKFGYYSKNLALNSGKKIVANCDKCNKIREIRIREYRSLCYFCSQIGRKCSKETKEKISLARKGKTYNEIFGKEKAEEIRRKMSEAKKGKKCYLYKDGKTSLIKSIYTLFESGNWRKQVFERDHFTCQNCNLIGCKLEAHHKVKLKVILKEFLQKYSNLDIEKDKEQLLEIIKKYPLFWDINNGITLCLKCHSLIEKRGF